MTRSNVLVINCGSSSLKFALIEPESGTVLRHGLAERLNTAEARLTLDSSSERLTEGATHEALERVLAHLRNERPSVVGHRVVHGGETFANSVLLDEPAIEGIKRCSALAPLHNPANVLGIEAARQFFPDVPQVAVFDTSFHSTLPPRAYLYAVPYELYEQHQVRRYGFHGSSHGYVAAEAAKRIGRPLAELQLVTVHLGNGCSATAVKGGLSLDTTMGLTPLEGLVMGTRSGDVDANLHQFLADHTGRTLPQISELLNRQSGLLGLSGTSNDMRTLVEAAAQGHVRASLAIEVYCYRLAKGILSLCAALERLDALVFTGGVGEHAASIRSDTLARLAILGATVDPDANQAHGRDTQGVITRAESRLLALVVPTNEELVIAREAARLTRS